jgi:hypothetical protein
VEKSDVPAKGRLKGNAIPDSWCHGMKATKTGPARVSKVLPTA